MKLLVLLFGALLLAGCNPYVPPEQPLPEGEVDPPVVETSQRVQFVPEGAMASWQFSDSPTQITGAYARDVVAPITVRCIPYPGYAVVEWEGAASWLGDTATVMPSSTARTVTAILAPSGGG